MDSFQSQTSSPTSWQGDGAISAQPRPNESGRERPGLAQRSGRTLGDFPLGEQRADLIRYLARLGVPKRMLEELTQDVLLVAHTRRDNFRGQSSTRTWLRGIAFHLVLNWRRRKANHEQCCDSLSNVSEADCGWHATARDAFSDCALRELCRRIERVLDAQPEAARRLWVMVVLEESPVAVAARSLDLNEQHAHLLLAKTNGAVRNLVLKRGAARGAHYRTW